MYFLRVRLHISQTMVFVWSTLAHEIQLPCPVAAWADFGPSHPAPFIVMVPRETFTVVFTAVDFIPLDGK